MYLLVGLGNPGEKYTMTRHNAGFIALDYLAVKNGLVFCDSKWPAEIIETALWQTPLLLLKPQTYMNLSGEALALVVSSYQLSPRRVIVIHDDIDLPLGRIKIVAKGGDGGHRGIRSIIERLGSRDFQRIKIGIGRGQESETFRSAPVERYVLSEFAQAERLLLDEVLPAVEDGVRLIVKEGVASAMNRINRRKITGQV